MFISYKIQFFKSNYLATEVNKVSFFGLQIFTFKLNPFKYRTAEHYFSKLCPKWKSIHINVD